MSPEAVKRLAATSAQQLEERAAELPVEACRELIKQCIELGVTAMPFTIENGAERPVAASVDALDEAEIRRWTRDLLLIGLGAARVMAEPPAE